MTAKSNDLTKSDQKLYVESYKASAKRMNFNGNEYLTILTDAVKQYGTHKKEAKDLFETSKKNGTTTLIWFLKHKEIELKMKQNELIAITFAAMFLESVIWDYAAINTSQNLAKEHLSKLDLVGKWKVVPKLINGKNLNIGSKAIGLLKKLNKERNKIVHSKSKPVPNSYDEYMEYVNRVSGFKIDGVIECIKECIKELEDVDTTNYWFLNTETVKEDIPRLEYIEPPDEAINLLSIT